MDQNESQYQSSEIAVCVALKVDEILVESHFDIRHTIGSAVGLKESKSIALSRIEPLKALKEPLQVGWSVTVGLNSAINAHRLRKTLGPGNTIQQ